MLLIIVIYGNGRFPATIYCNDSCDVGPPRSTACWQVITVFLLFAVYSGLMMDGVQSETCS